MSRELSALPGVWTCGALRAEGECSILEYMGRRHASWIATILLLGCTQADRRSEADGSTSESDGPPYACAPSVGISCTSELQLEHDVVSSKGFSADQILDSVAGRYAFPITWVDPCGGVSECRQIGHCETAASPPALSVSGTQTVLRLDLVATGEPAIVPTPGPGQAGCVVDMRIPGRMSLQSDDGAIDSEQAVQIWTACGNEASVSLDGPATMLGGSLTSELPADATVEFFFGATYDQRVWLGTYFMDADWDGGRGTLLLRSEIVSDESCPQDVAKDEVFSGALAGHVPQSSGYRPSRASP